MAAGPAAGDHGCGPADTPLRLLTCDESILT
jgi:hypothetical protein